jgi:hypothetical protein
VLSSLSKSTSYKITVVIVVVVAAAAVADATNTGDTLHQLPQKLNILLPGTPPSGHVT